MYKNVFDLRWDWKNLSILALLAIFPNLLGLYHIDLFGFRIHFFQYLIFVAAIMYGPVGGMISAAFGSAYTALALNNPYVIVGNVMLAFFFGLFIRLRWNVLMAALAAFAIQLPWLIFTDIYLAGMPIPVVRNVVIALFVTDILWALLARTTLFYHSKHQPDIDS